MSSQEEYFERLNSGLDEAWDVASSAREDSNDPEEEIEIKRAKDMAERTEMFLEIDGLAEAIRGFQEEGFDREDISFKLTEKFLDGELGDFDDQEKKIEYAIRSSLAVLTEAVVAAPLEGLIEIKIENDNPDGSEYIRVKYGGPIRSAGGTGQVISVLIADYCRQELGIDEWKPTDDEVERYVEEINLYHNTFRNLQYHPSDDEARKIIRNTPIMVDAEPVTDQEVSGYRDLDRIDTNSGRGGMCLVLAEGVAQKVPKLQKYTEELGLEGWDWLNELPNASKIGDGEEEENEENEEEGDKNKEQKHGRIKVKPKTKYIDDTLTAGRPIIGHPSQPGGFRLRYGRGRNAGMAAGSISTATMTALYDYIGPGTQLKTERPGKAIAVSPDDSSLQGPTVRLKDGTVMRIDTEEKAKELREDIEKFIDLGEIGIPLGEFIENNAQLVPASFTHDWWVKESEKTDFDAKSVEPERLNARQAWNISEKYELPLHPKYTYLWHDIDFQEYVALSNALKKKEELENGAIEIPYSPSEILEKLLVPHKQDKDEDKIKIEEEHAFILEKCCKPESIEESDNIMEAVNSAAGVEIRERAPTRIGTRMGRPEKAEKRTFQRNLNSHLLFPVGEQVQRSVFKASKLDNGNNQTLNDDDKKPKKEGTNLNKGQSEVEISTRLCPECKEETYHPRCPECDVRTNAYTDCPKCNTTVFMENSDMGQKDCPECGKEDITANKQKVVDIAGELHEALEKLNVRKSQLDDITGVEGLVSQEKVPEPMEKGVLRAKHDLGIFKDGTSRFDATNLPLTAFKPEEINVSVEKLRELGYKTDINGEPLEDPDQLLELKQQDVVLPKSGADYMLRGANFIDELLEKYYDEEPFYNAETKSDLAGEFIIGLAPHTSAGALGRIIGYVEGVEAQYAHPIFYGAKRRNCFHPDETLHYQVEHENGDTEWKYGTIQELVETYIDPNNLQKDDLGSEYSPPTKTIQVPSINENGEQVLKELNKVQRNPAPDHMVTFQTETGRKITVTPDHGMLVYENGEQKEIPASKVEEGDKFLELTHLDAIDGNNTKQLDLLKELSESEKVDNTKLTIANLTENEVKQLYEQAFNVNTNNNYLAQLGDRLNTSKKTISNYVHRGNIPINFLLQGFKNTDELCKAVPNDARLGWKQNHVTAKRFVKLDEKLATFLGYYAAEGLTRNQEGGVSQVTISATEDEAREFALNAFHDCFGVEADEQNEHKITASSAIVQQAMKHVFDAGDYSHKKKVPEIIMTTSDKELIGSFLGGYISGGGSILSDRITVGTTVSKRLKTDITSLLNRLGVESSVHTEQSQDLHKHFPDYYEEVEKKPRKAYTITVKRSQAHKLMKYCKIHLQKKNKMGTQFESNITNKNPNLEYGDSATVRIDSKEIKESDSEYTYNVEVNETHNLNISSILSFQCDSDEDAFMLLLDGLLNYSEHYLNHNKSGKFMDEPIVMNSIIDPSEIDDEAHNVDIVDESPLELYEKSMEGAGPEEVDIETLGDRLDNPTGILHSLDTDSISGGPDMTVYKTLPDMDSKIDEQFKISRQVRATDERDVAEKVIDGHFLADLMGNLRAFGTQDVRCTNCHHNHDRPPLDGVCRKCGSTDSWTINVHEGSVTKYLKKMKEISRIYDVSDYIKEVIDEYDRAIDSLFENDKDKQSGLSEFME